MHDLPLHGSNDYIFQEKPPKKRRKSTVLRVLPTEKSDFCVESEPSSDDQINITNIEADLTYSDSDGTTTDPYSDDGSVAPEQSLEEIDKTDVSDLGNISGNDEPHISDGEDVQNSNLSPHEQVPLVEKISNGELFAALTDKELLEILMKKEGVSECGCSMIFRPRLLDL